MIYWPSAQQVESQVLNDDNILYLKSIVKYTYEVFIEIFYGLSLDENKSPFGRKKLLSDGNVNSPRGEKN